MFRRCNKDNKTFLKGEGGFTLIELLIVLAIIAAFVALALVSTQGSSDKKNATLIQREAQLIASGLTLYKGDIGRYPVYLQNLWDKSVLTPAEQPHWRGSYYTPSLTTGSSPNMNVADARVSGVTYSYARITTTGGSGSCANAGQIGTNNSGGVDHVVRVSGVPLEAARRIRENLGLKACVSSDTNDPVDVYIVIEEVS